MTSTLKFLPMLRNAETMICRERNQLRPLQWTSLNYLSFSLLLNAACAAANLATGTRNGEQLT